MREMLGDVDDVGRGCARGAGRFEMGLIELCERCGLDLTEDVRVVLEMRGRFWLKLLVCAEVEGRFD